MSKVTVACPECDHRARAVEGTHVRCKCGAVFQAMLPDVVPVKSRTPVIVLGAIGFAVVFLVVFLSVFFRERNVPDLRSAERAGIRITITDAAVKKVERNINGIPHFLYPISVDLQVDNHSNEVVTYHPKFDSKVQSGWGVTFLDSEDLFSWSPAKQPKRIQPSDSTSDQLLFLVSQEFRQRNFPSQKWEWVGFRVFPDRERQIESIEVFVRWNQIRNSWSWPGPEKVNRPLP